MFKNFLIIFFLIFLTNCSHPGTALLGPAFTGVTTKSLGQTSLSYGTNQIIKKVQETSKKTKKKVQETSKKTKKDVKKIAKKIENFDLETKSKNFYASVTNLYLQDQLQKKESFLFHR